jgi:hypothetical protein
MQAKHGQTQIPMPTITDDPRWIGRFSREVRKSIAALRDRQVIITGQNIRFQLKNCPFGQLFKYREGSVEKTAIQGGSLYAGDKVWNVDKKDINLSSSGTYHVWLQIGVIANSSDGVLLPGLDTSTTPVWQQASGTGSYPSQTIPTGSSPSGTAIVALGILTIENNRASFVAEACGPIQISHCPGSLTNSRIS